MIHSHSLNSVMATVYCPGSEFVVTHEVRAARGGGVWLRQRRVARARPDSAAALAANTRAVATCVSTQEMIKGIRAHDNFDACVVPIVENTAYECDLTDRLAAALQSHPR